ncbi:response regulator [Mesobacterium sp. TK19101]|uniref:Response regulator n=1 Tax=Mesobacterium hydrothermale TaxID=3111907 RepID=A0ABU6HL28_9RHOB|nr:response regulator [Mesobacterium sp. TK19101]MEC3863162.1 response regulator [Mesobacterium sp. TK19101]
MKFLAVDDEPLILDVLKSTLAESGYSDVILAETAADALRIAKAEHIDCFIIDIQMPVMTGVDLTAALRAIDAYAKTPILMNTSLSERHHVDQAFAAGATDYITKPLDRIEFATRLRNVRRMISDNSMAEALKQKSNGVFRKAFRLSREFPEIDHMLEFPVFENYIKTLSRKNLLANSLLSIQVENAAKLYTETTIKVYDTVLADIASAISGALSPAKGLFTHTGGGDFVVVLDRLSKVDPESFLCKVRLAMSVLEMDYNMDGIPVPRILLGKQIVPSFFSSTKPALLLERVMDKSTPRATPVVLPSDQSLRAIMFS